MICPRCSKENVEEANYCKYCGTLFSYRGDSLEKVEKRIRRREILNILAIVVIIAIVIFFIVISIFEGAAVS